MIVFLGFVFQLVFSLGLIGYGYAVTTNLGFSTPKALEVVIGLIIMAIGVYGMYDLSTMFNYVGE